MQLLESYVKTTWLPELEERVGRLKDHSEETRRLEEKEISLRELEATYKSELEILITSRKEIEALKSSLNAELSAASARTKEIDLLQDSLRNTVASVTIGVAATMPTVFRGEFGTADIREWITINNAPQPLLTRLYVSLQMLGISEDMKSKELYLTVGAECYRLVQEIDRTLGTDGLNTRKLAETLSQKNVFEFKFRIPQKGQTVEPQWMIGPAGIVNVVECWGILDSANNGKKALVK
jgi:hypothetical protein